TEIIFNKTKNAVVVGGEENDISYVVVAPGEGKIPTNILREENPFVLAFPILFPDGKNGLHDKEREVPITPQQFVEQRILNHNAIFRNNIAFVFTACFYIEKHQLENKINVSYRRGKITQTTTGTSKMNLNDDFSIFHKIKGTPKYWQSFRYDVIAELEQLGVFVFFYTLSCADKRWDEMWATILRSEGYNVMHIDEEYEYEKNEDDTSSEYYVHELTGRGTNLIDDDHQRECNIHSTPELVCRRIPLDDFEPEQTKHEIIKKHILTATRMFDKRVQAFRKHIIQGPNNPMHVEFLQDKTEFQQRAWPHVHGVLWCNLEELEKVDRYKGIKSIMSKLRHEKDL
ncbi:MAG TPA: hypothetical protein EYO76_12510, partial [Flavobacteriaceae bacterium]|nr:hypothetical protein [Flavobacteriaceae bacterium]